MTVPLKKETIDEIFDNAVVRGENQQDVIYALYQSVFGDVWDRIDSVEGYPTCHKDTWRYICQKFMEFDRKKSPDVLPGGTWINYGFSALDGESVAQWVVTLPEYKLND